MAFGSITRNRRCWENTPRPLAATVTALPVRLPVPSPSSDHTAASLGRPDTPSKRAGTYKIREPLHTPG